MNRFLLLPIAAALASASLAQAQTPPENERTVTYYADNPYVREKVLKQCIDDLSHLKSRPDCLNARTGENVDAARKGEGMFFHGEVPSPAYFSWSHEQRSATLSICRYMTAARKAGYGHNCEDAEASIEADQPRIGGALPQAPTIR